MGAPAPAGLDLSAARNLFLKLVDVGGDPAAREAAFTRLAAWLDNPHP